MKEWASERTNDRRKEGKKEWKNYLWTVIVRTKEIVREKVSPLHFFFFSSFPSFCVHCQVLKTSDTFIIMAYWNSMLLLWNNNSILNMEQRVTKSSNPREKKKKKRMKLSRYKKNKVVREFFSFFQLGKKEIFEGVSILFAVIVKNFSFIFLINSF